MCKITMKNFESASDGTFGNISAIARNLNVCRSAVYRFLDQNPKAMQIVEAGREAFDDIAEETLQRKIMEGDTTLLKFYASTRLKKRGYSSEEKTKEEPPEFRVTLLQENSENKK